MEQLKNEIKMLSSMIEMLEKSFQSFCVERAQFIHESEPNSPTMTLYNKVCDFQVCISDAKSHLKFAKNDLDDKKGNRESFARTNLAIAVECHAKAMEAYSIRYQW